MITAIVGHPVLTQAPRTASVRPRSNALRASRAARYSAPDPAAVGGAARRKGSPDPPELLATKPAPRARATARTSDSATAARERDPDTPEPVPAPRAPTTPAASPRRRRR